MNILLFVLGLYVRLARSVQNAVDHADRED